MSRRVPLSDAQKFQRKQEAYAKFHKDKDGVKEYVAKLADAFKSYVFLSKKVTGREIKNVEYDQPGTDGKQRITDRLQSGDLRFLASEITRMIKDFNRIFTWAKRRVPVMKKRAGDLSAGDLKGNLAPTILGPALLDFVKRENITNPAGQSLLQTLRQVSGGQSLLEGGYALSTGVTNVLFLAAYSNSLQRDAKTRALVSLDPAFQTSFGGSIPALYSYGVDAAGKRVKTDNKAQDNTFAILNRKDHAKAYNTASGTVPTSAFQEIKALNIYTAADLKAQKPSPQAVAFLQDPVQRGKLLNEYKVIAQFTSEWSHDPKTLAAKEAVQRTQASARAKSPRK